MGAGRYGAGQARCQVCDVWVDAKGARLKDGSIATAGSVGWYCRCCNYRMRTRPRNIKYKSRLVTADRIGADAEDGDASSIDLSYFSRTRANLLRRLASVLPEGRDDIGSSEDEHFSAPLLLDLRSEFSDVGELLDLAYEICPPNKIALVVEFERIRSDLDKVPTKDEFEKISPVGVSAYDHEFGSWENFLDKMGYDPWYRIVDETDGKSRRDVRSAVRADRRADTTHLDYEDHGGYDDAATLRGKIRAILEHDTDALGVFEMLELDIGDVDPAVLHRLADEVVLD